MLTCEALTLVLLLLLINYRKHHHFTIQIRVLKLGVSWFKITLNVKISNVPAASCQDIEH